MEPVPVAPKSPPSYNWLMGALVFVGAAQVFVQMTEREGGTARTVSILLNLLLVVLGVVGFFGNRNKRSK
jgi:hypothetical protein